MKKRQSRTKVFSKASKKANTSSKRKGVLIAKAVNPIDYAKVISYIVKSEENETNLMIAALTSTQH